MSVEANDNPNLERTMDAIIAQLTITPFNITLQMELAALEVQQELDADEVG